MNMAFTCKMKAMIGKVVNVDRLLTALAEAVQPISTRSRTAIRR
jgi:hypothetical protein